MFIDDKGYLLESNEADDNIRTLESDSNHCAFYHSTQYHMVVKVKACGNVTVGRGL